jgi:hypothetical protein
MPWPISRFSLDALVNIAAFIDYRIRIESDGAVLNLKKTFA